MAYFAHETQATKVPLTIQNGKTIVELLVDQAQPLPAGEAFRSIGKVELQKDLETTVTIRNAETDGFVIFGCAATGG